MKNFKLLALLFVSAAVMFTSCDPEPTEPGTGNPDGPSLSLSAEAGYISDDATLSPGEIFTVKLSVTPGTSDLNLFSLSADDINLSTDQFTIDGNNPGANPNKLILGDDKTGLTWEISIVAHDIIDFQSYEFTVSDEDGNSNSTSVVITTESQDPPTVTAGGSPEVTLPGSSLYSIMVNAQPAVGASLASIAIYENGVLVDASRAEVGAYAFDDNPYSLPAEYQTGFEENVIIRIQDQGVSAYEVVITDDFGNSSTISKNVSVEAAGTPVSLISGALLNSFGPAGTGGLDLDTGNGTGSSDPLAEIKDEGVDASLPNASNWKQQISGVNGSVVKYLVPGSNGLQEGFTFTSVDSKETVAALHANGVDFNGGVSNMVSTGDMFTVENNGKYYVLVVTDIFINEIDNSDQYTFSIKL